MYILYNFGIVLVNKLVLLEDICYIVIITNQPGGLCNNNLSVFSHLQNIYDYFGLKSFLLLYLCFWRLAWSKILILNKLLSCHWSLHFQWYYHYHNNFIFNLRIFNQILWTAIDSNYVPPHVYLTIEYK